MNTKAKLITAIVSTALLGTGAIAMTQNEPQIVEPTPTPEITVQRVQEPEATEAPTVQAPPATPTPQAKPVVTPDPPKPTHPPTPQPTKHPVDNGDGTQYIDDTPNDIPPVVVPMPTPHQ
jgi:hypothetical protein